MREEGGIGPAGSFFILQPSALRGGQVELVGPLNWLIRSAGLVSWEDLFDGNGEPRDFEDVVRRKGLTLEQLGRAGVAEGVARRAGGPGPMGR